MTHKIEGWQSIMRARLQLSILLTLGAYERSTETCILKKNVLKWGICMTFCSNFKARERRFSIQTFRKCHSRTQIGSERHFWVSLQPSVLNDNLRGPGWRPGQPRKLTQANNNPTVRYKLILDHLVQIYRLKNWLGLTMHTE